MTDNVKRQKKGRPTKFKKDMLSDIEKLSGLGFTEEEVAVYWEVSSRTLTRWKKKNPDLCRAIEKGKLHANVSVTKELFNKATQGNLTAIIFWLTNRAPEIWQDRRALVNNQQIMVSKNGEPAAVTAFKDNELDEFISNILCGDVSAGTQTAERSSQPVQG